HVRGGGDSQPPRLAGQPAVHDRDQPSGAWKPARDRPGRLRGAVAGTAGAAEAAEPEPDVVPAGPVRPRRRAGRALLDRRLLPRARPQAPTPARRRAVPRHAVAPLVRPTGFSIGRTGRTTAGNSRWAIPPHNVRRSSPCWPRSRWERRSRPWRRRRVAARCRPGRPGRLPERRRPPDRGQPLCARLGEPRTDPETARPGERVRALRVGEPDPGPPDVAEGRRTFDEPVQVAGADTTVTSAAVTFRLEITQPVLHDSVVLTHTVHAVPTGTRWAGMLPPDRLELHRSGTCGTTPANAAR